MKPTKQYSRETWERVFCGCLCRLDSEQSHQKTQLIWGNLSWGMGHHLPEKESDQARCLAQSTVLWPVNKKNQHAKPNRREREAKSKKMREIKLTREGIGGWETRILRRMPAPESSPGSKRALRDKTCWTAWDLFQEGLRIPVTTRVSRHSRGKRKKWKEPRGEKFKN